MNIPLRGKQWSEHERGEIGRSGAWTSTTRTRATPWCVIYDQQHHRIVLQIARIERRYVVVWPREGTVCGDAEHARHP
jgi:hypothetical protein